jgi:hypothetical protein
MTLLKPHNIYSTHLKGIETSFQVVPLFQKSFHFWLSFEIFSKYLQSLKGYRQVDHFSLGGDLSEVRMYSYGGQNKLCLQWIARPR